MQILAKVLCLGFLLACVSCSGGTVPTVRDYTSGVPTRHVNPQSVIGRCPPYQPNCIGGGGGGGGGGTDPVYTIQCPYAPSCTGSADYTIGQTVPCVTQYGTFTTGCGGDPGSNGAGIGVFYLDGYTCYLDFATMEQNCFAAANTPPSDPDPDQTITYCFDKTSGYKTQHWYNLPSHVHGVTVLGHYSDIYKTVRLAFLENGPSATQGVEVWGNPPPGPAAVQNSTSSLSMWENGSLYPPAAPHYLGHARRAPTDSLCKQSL